jgi:hypothetical protein
LYEANNIFFGLKPTTWEARGEHQQTPNAHRKVQQASAPQLKLVKIRTNQLPNHLLLLKFQRHSTCL